MLDFLNNIYVHVLVCVIKLYHLSFVYFLWLYHDLLSEYWVSHLFASCQRLEV